MNKDHPDQWLLGAVGASLPLLDELYAQYQKDPAAVDPTWRALFEGRPVSWAPRVAPPAPGAAAAAAAADPNLAACVHALVHAFRVRGHLEANLDPLGSLVREKHPDLDPASYGIGPPQLAEVVH